MRTCSPPTRRPLRLAASAAGQPPRGAGCGEIGLDYHYDFSPREVQQAVFRAQLRVARERDLPVVIHTREAEDDTLRILGEEGAGPPARRVPLLLRRRRPRHERWPRVLPVDPRYRLVSEGRGTAAGRGRRAAGPAAGRDRQPVPGAGPVSRQAQRAGLVAGWSTWWPTSAAWARPHRPGRSIATSSACFDRKSRKAQRFKALTGIECVDTAMPYGVI